MTNTATATTITPTEAGRIDRNADLVTFTVVFDLSAFYDGNVDSDIAKSLIMEMIEDKLNECGEFSGYQDVYAA